jgi:hypothetical protein
MEVVFTVVGILMAVIGLAALIESATGTRTALHAVAHTVMLYRGREQSRAYRALASLALMAFGVFIGLPGTPAGYPLWPAGVAVGLYAILAIVAHLYRDEG